MKKTLDFVKLGNSDRTTCILMVCVQVTTSHVLDLKRFRNMSPQSFQSFFFADANTVKSILYVLVLTRLDNPYLHFFISPLSTMTLMERCVCLLFPTVVWLKGQVQDGNAPCERSAQANLMGDPAVLVQVDSENTAHMTRYSLHCVLRISIRLKTTSRKKLCMDPILNKHQTKVSVKLTKMSIVI